VSKKESDTEIKGTVCVTHYFKEENDDQSLLFISAAYVDFLHKKGKEIRQSFLYKIDSKKGLKKSQKEVEEFIDKICSFAEKKDSVLIFGKDLLIDSKQTPGKPGIPLGFISKDEYLKDPGSFHSSDIEDEDSSEEQMIYLSTYALTTGEVFGLGMNHFDFNKNKTIKEETFVFDKNRTLLQSEKDLESFIKKWTKYASKVNSLIMELEPIESATKKVKVNANFLSHEQYLAHISSESANKPESEDGDEELNPKAEGVVTITPYFDAEQKLKLLSSVYVDFKNGKGSEIARSDILWVDFDKNKSMQSSIDGFIQYAKKFATQTNSEFMMIDSQELQFCNDLNCNCGGEPKLSYLSHSSFLDLFSSQNPTSVVSSNKKDGQWLN
jgi:hypothetical protein